MYYCFVCRLNDSFEPPFNQRVLREQVDLRKKNENGETALHRAAGHGHGDVVVLLLGRMEGADVATKDRLGKTALHWAAWRGDADVVTLLLGRMKGADVAAKDKNGETALHCAAERGHTDVVVLLERALEKESTSRIRGNANEDHQP